MGAVVDDVAVGGSARFEMQFSLRKYQAFCCGFSSGHFAGSGTMMMLAGMIQPRRHMRSGLIDDQHGVAAVRELRRDLGQVPMPGLPQAARCGPYRQRGQWAPQANGQGMRPGSYG